MWDNCDLTVKPTAIQISIFTLSGTDSQLVSINVWLFGALETTTVLNFKKNFETK
jgi:hypothetical protein